MNQIEINHSDDSSPTFTNDPGDGLRFQGKIRLKNILDQKNVFRQEDIEQLSLERIELIINNLDVMSTEDYEELLVRLKDKKHPPNHTNVEMYILTPGIGLGPLPSLPDGKPGYDRKMWLSAMDDISGRSPSALGPIDKMATIVGFAYTNIVWSWIEDNYEKVLGAAAGMHFFPHIGVSALAGAALGSFTVKATKIFWDVLDRTKEIFRAGIEKHKENCPWESDPDSVNNAVLAVEQSTGISDILPATLSSRREQSAVVATVFIQMDIRSLIQGLGQEASLPLAANDDSIQEPGDQLLSIQQMAALKVEMSPDDIMARRARAKPTVEREISAAPGLRM